MRISFILHKKYPFLFIQCTDIITDRAVIAPSGRTLLLDYSLPLRLFCDFDSIHPNHRNN